MYGMLYHPNRYPDLLDRSSDDEKEEREEQRASNDHFWFNTIIAIAIGIAVFLTAFYFSKI